MASLELGLEKKGCIITGASSGIGLATARSLAELGAYLLLVARDKQRLIEAARSCKSQHVETLPLDVTNPAAGELMAEACEALFGHVDVLVCNAGTNRIANLGELGDEEWQRQWELNVMAPLRVMRAVAPRMAAQGWGRIVNVVSSSGKRPSTRNAAYAVCKTAQQALSRVFADTYAGRGVLVNAVAPGPTATPLWTGTGGLADQLAERLGESQEGVLRSRGTSLPLGRMGRPDEVASVIVVLCSEVASNVVGATWSVDGGAVPLVCG